jgi:hypothetical protein
MRKIKYPISWVKWRVAFAKEITDKSHSPGEFNALIRVIGLSNVLRFIS